jgi:hypothetical protein
MELKKRQILGQTESSVSMVFPRSSAPKNRLVADVFQLTFSCNFDFAGFPFDFQECPIKYGDALLGQERMMFNTTRARFGNLTTKSGDDPIVIDNLPFPFEFQIVALPTFELHTNSYTGVVLKMTRKSPRQLLSGYFYPMGAFAYLSMISFLIKPDMVSSLR